MNIPSLLFNYSTVILLDIALEVALDQAGIVGFYEILCLHDEKENFEAVTSGKWR